MRARSSKLSGVRPSNASASAMQAVPGDGQVLAHGPGPNGHASRADEAGGEVVIAETAPVISGAGRLVRNVALLLSSQVLIWVVTFASNIFVPRGLGPAHLGQLTVATSVGTILDTVFALGYGALMVKEIARDHSRAPALVGTALITRAFLLLPATGTVAALTVAIHAGPELTGLIWLAAAATFIGLFVGPFNASLQALERMEFTAIANALSRTLVAAASIVLVAFHYGPGHILGTMIATSALLVLLFWRWSGPVFRIDWTLEWSRARHLVLGSLPYWSTGLLLSFYMWIDSLMLSAMAPIAVVGWYSVPIRLFGSLLFLPAILGTAYLPRLSRAFNAGSEPLGREARRFLEIALSVSFPLTVGLLLVSWQLVWVLYGLAYMPSVPVLMVVALSLPPTYLNIVANQVLIAANRQLNWTWVMVGASIANPVMNLFLIRAAQQRYGNGALGAAAALLLTEVGMATVGLVLLLPMLRWSTAGRLLRAAAATGVMAIAVLLVARHNGLTAMVLSGGLSFALATLVFGVLRPDERQMLLRLLSTGRARAVAAARSAIARRRHSAKVGRSSEQVASAEGKERDA